MPAHDPLTQSQINLLAQITATPLSMSIEEQTQSPHGNDLSFLLRTGFINAELEYQAQNTVNDRYRFVRSTKLLD